MKVLHDSASSNAIGNLQRDFGIQISNVFDIKHLASQIKNGSSDSEPGALWKSYCGDKDIPLKAEHDVSQALAFSTIPLANRIDLVKQVSHNSFSLLPLAKIIGNSLSEDKLLKSHQEFNAKQVQGAKYILNS